MAWLPATIIRLPVHLTLPRDGRSELALGAGAEQARIDEEISRAARHGTALSCLLVGIDDLDEIARAHGDELSRAALAYPRTALGRTFGASTASVGAGEGELLVVLPGADGRRGEIVARRALERLRAIKIEVAGARAARISVGLVGGAGVRAGLLARAARPREQAADAPRRAAAATPARLAPAERP